MKIQEQFDAAVEMLKGYYETRTNWMRGVAVEEALRIANKTGRDAGDVFEDMDRVAKL
jgi:hypothetical protein